MEEVWYADYEARTLEIRRRSGDGYQPTELLREDQTVTTELFPGLSFPVDALWAGIPD